MTSRFVAALVLGSAMILAACGDADPSDPVLILAASSTTGYLDDFIANVRAASPELGPAAVSYGGSNALVEQARSGVPAQLLVLAHTADTFDLQDDWRAESWVANALVIAVPDGNPGQVEALADLTRPELRVAICAPEVPCGRALGARYDTIAPDSVEPSVRSVLAKVEQGEVDAGIVFRTDAASSAKVLAIEITPPPTSRYTVINLTPGTPHADAWEQAMLQEGRAFFESQGFSP